MTRTFTTQIASFALAALMTLGMLGSIDGFAKAETRLGAASVLVAQSAQPAGQAGAADVRSSPPGACPG